MKVKQEPTPKARKQVKKISSRPGKRRKSMQVINFESLEDDDDEDKPIEKDVQEAKTTTDKKVWKLKLENLNMKIINVDNFV